MKLSNQQVNALAEKIKSELVTIKRTPIVQFNDSIYNSEEYKNFYNTNADCVYLNELHKRLPTLSDYHFDSIQKEIRIQYFKSKFKEIPILPSIEYIINEIHLATIDSNDLTSLIESVTSKFK